MRACVRAITEGGPEVCVMQQVLKATGKGMGDTGLCEAGMTEQDMMRITALLMQTPITKYAGRHFYQAGYTKDNKSRIQCARGGRG